MGSNTHEELSIARSEIDAAILKERSSGYEDQILDHIEKARAALDKAEKIQKLIKGHREGEFHKDVQG